MCKHLEGNTRQDGDAVSGTEGSLLYTDELIASHRIHSQPKLAAAHLSDTRLDSPTSCPQSTSHACLGITYLGRHQASQRHVPSVLPQVWCYLHVTTTTTIVFRATSRTLTSKRARDLACSVAIECGQPCTEWL